MDTPRKISTSGDSITITWAALTEANTRGQAVQSYRIGYQECATNDVASCESEVTYSPEASSCNTASTNVPGSTLKVSCPEYSSLYDITGLKSNKYYNIKIAARNSCGIGLYTTPVMLTTMDCPSQVTGTVTEIEGANVNVIWDSQDNVSSYEILFQKVDGSWAIIDDCDGNPATVNADGKPYCQLLNSKIKTETTLAD